MEYWNESKEYISQYTPQGLYKLIVNEILKKGYRIYRDKQACCAVRWPIGKIHPFSKIPVTFKPVMQFGCHSRFRISLKIVKWSILWQKAPSSTNLGRGGDKDIFTNHYWMTNWMNEWITEVFVKQPLASLGSAKYLGSAWSHYDVRKAWLLGCSSCRPAVTPTS